MTGSAVRIYSVRFRGDWSGVRPKDAPLPWTDLQIPQTLYTHKFREDGESTWQVWHFMVPQSLASNFEDALNHAPLVVHFYIMRTEA